MTRFLVTLFFLTQFLFCQEYPQYFRQLSTPLFDYKNQISKLSDVENIYESSASYLKEMQSVKEYGYMVDISQNQQEIKEYLSKLRKLQSKYDYILHQVHESIDGAIDENDYELFIKLTESKFDGLLKNRALSAKSISFYNLNKSKKKSSFFEKKIKHDKLALATSQEFFNVASSSTYNSTNKIATKKKSVSLEAVDVGDYISVYIQNNNPYTVTVKVKESYENLDYDKSTLKEFALISGIKKEYIKLYKQKGVTSYSYNYNYSWIIGSIDAIHDDYIYNLPYAVGDTHMISQGFNGTVSHKGHSQYAVDFAMEIGTKVYAARDGVVVKTKSSSDKGGASRKFSKHGNYITIEHSDFTFATYYHLKKNGVGVKVGQKVNKGEFIGYSGNTGYSSGPHLHLAVFKASSSTTTKTLPVKFNTTSGIVDEPKIGNYYIAK